jgi:hypothetical protein
LHLIGSIGRKVSPCSSGALTAVLRERGRQSQLRPNARWSLDFVHDQFASGRRFRILNIVGDITRECLAAIPDTSMSNHGVRDELGAIVRGDHSRRYRLADLRKRKNCWDISLLKRGLTDLLF